MLISFLENLKDLCMSQAEFSIFKSTLRGSKGATKEFIPSSYTISWLPLMELEQKS